jgi:hypothetical protein
MPIHTIIREGILAEKLPMLTAEKKKGRKKKRYITDMEVHMNLSFSVNSLPSVVKRKARTRIPAPARKRINLKNRDRPFVIEDLPIRFYYRIGDKI